MSEPVIEVESAHALPLVHFQIVLPGGALSDPAQREGLSRLAARLIRRGSRQRSANEVEHTIDSLGAELGIDIGYAHVRVTGSVIRRNAEPMLALVGELLREPALGETALGQLKRETLAQLTEMLDSDGSLAARQFRRMMFGGHPYGRSSVGTRASVSACSLDDVHAHYARGLAHGPRLIGFAGDVTEEQAHAWSAKHLAFPAAGKLPDMPQLPPLPACEGRTLCVVDKPARTQTQVYIGRPGTHPRDTDHHALILGNAIFGGTFTSRLMRAVRSERGWSYGASSRLGVDRVRDTWTMWTHPAAEDAAACVALQLSLMEDWVRDGVSDDEVEFAQSYLVKSHAFAVDTADKRLDQRIDQQLLDLPVDYFTTYTDNLRRVTTQDVNEALRQRLDPAQLRISVLATEAEVGAGLRDQVTVDDYSVWPYDREA